MANSIVKALGIMLKAHRGQTDRSGRPYWMHPLHVACRCRDKNEIIVALLHDVVEDSDMSIPELKANGFSKEITDAVDCLTRKPYVDYMTYIEVVKENPIARAVKLKDLEHNMNIRRIKGPSDEDFKRVEKYRKAHGYLM